MRCFYDADEQIDLWGKYLPEELPAIYGEQAAAAVVFISADSHTAETWTSSAPAPTPATCTPPGS